MAFRALRPLPCEDESLARRRGPEYRMQPTEAADYLHVTTATVERWVRQGLLPHGSTAGEPFDRDELERWACERGLPHGTSAARAPERAERLFSSAVARGAVQLGVAATTASEAITAAVTAAPGLDEPERARLLDDVLARERLASTALGRGIALPHPRQPLVGLLADPVVSIVQLADPIDWASLDGAPVRVAMLLLSPSAPVHLQLLSRVSLALRQDGMAAWLADGPDADALVQRVRSIEESFGG